MSGKTASQNSEVLASFVAFCKAHPEQRFWQALRNWAGMGLGRRFNFIFVSQHNPEDWRYCESRHSFSDEVEDTFNWKGRNQ